MALSKITTNEVETLLKLKVVDLVEGIVGYLPGLINFQLFKIRKRFFVSGLSD
jgi:hypothetical protein